jgi:hypothetical protein
MRWEGNVAHMEEMRNSNTVFCCKNMTRKAFEKPTHRWESNVEMDLTEVGWEGMGWVKLAQYRFWLATPCKNCSEPSVNINNGRFTR